VHRLVGQSLLSKISEIESRAKAAISTTGWNFKKIYFNANNGFLKIEIARPDGKRQLRHITVYRSGYGKRVSIMREIIDIKESMHIGDWLDYCNSYYMGRQQFDHIGAAMLNCAIYIHDNPAPGFTAIGSRDSMRHIAAMVNLAEDELPNVRDHRAGPSDPSKAGQAIVAGSGASTCWADSGQEGKP
jgi:hypothetical protein